MKLIELRPAPAGIGGNLEARRTIASASRSRTELPDERARLTRVTEPRELIVNRTVAFPCMRALRAALG